MTYKNIMLDIETTGTDPSHTAIIQIAAVAFDLENQDLCLNMFDECLMPPNTLFWDEGTRDFWSEHPDVLQGIWNRMRDPRTVLTEFNAWVGEVTDGETPVLWAKPSHFEWPFIEQAYRRYDLAKPFHYREVNDLNSWCRARGLPKLSYEIDVQGDAHNAINDVLHQIQVLFTLMERTRVETIA